MTATGSKRTAAMPCRIRPMAGLPGQRVLDGGALHRGRGDSNGRSLDPGMKADEELTRREQDEGDGPGRDDALMRRRVDLGGGFGISLRHDTTSKAVGVRSSQPPLV